MIFVPLIVFAVLLLSAEIAIRSSGISAFVLPPPSAVVEALLQNWSVLSQDAVITAAEAFAGFFVALVFSFIAAVLIVRYETASRAIEPLAAAMRSTPIVALAPALALWLGFGWLPKIVVAALIAFPPLLANLVVGLRDVDRRLLDLFHSMNAGSANTLLRLRLPNALPNFFAATRICVSLALIGAVVAEWAGSSQGLGYRLLRAQASLDTTTVWAVALLLATLGILGSALVAAVERRLVTWK